MEISLIFEEEDGIITTPSGTKYYLQTLLDAIIEFNKKCPKQGGLINRNHIGHHKNITHITNFLKYENNELTADIELLDENMSEAKMRPIIKTPLRFESGVLIERILGINNILLEI